MEILDPRFGRLHKKIPHDEISIYDALDPLVDTDEVIKNHITYVDETIIEVNNSVKGRKTIKKYRLDSKVHDNRRQRQLIKLSKTIGQCLKNGGVQGLTAQDKEALRRYTYSSSPYSYMSECYLRGNLPEVLV